MSRYEIIECSESGATCKIIHGDSLRILPDLVSQIDACITDPPYGVKWQGHSASTLKWKPMQNDDGALDLRPMLNLGCRVVAFGANNYIDQLPHAGRWLCWDKRVNPNADRMIGSPFELIWSNQKKGYNKFYRLMHGGVVNADGHGVRRVHPTQKPIKLMEDIIKDFTEPGFTVLDPFMGSGTTGIACLRNGRNFIGVEIDSQHFVNAKARLQKAASRIETVHAESLPLFEWQASA